MHFHHVPALRSNALATVVSFFLPATWAIWREGPFDIIHAQGFACWQRSLLTAHICLAAWHVQRVASGHGLSWKESVFDACVSRLEYWLYRRSPARPLIAISHRVAQDLKNCYKADQFIRIIPHGVDVSEFDVANRPFWREEIRTRLGLAQNRFCALWVGDLRKGAKAAIEAIAKNPNQTLLLVSRNDPGEFRTWSQQCGAASRVLFLPPTREIAKFYAAADVFLFPTTYDAFGMVVLEAMAMDLPVIVSRSAGAAELIEPGVDGLWLDDPFDTQTAAAHLQYLEQDPAARHRLASAAGHKARKLGWDGVAASTYAVYQEWIATAQKDRL